MTLKPARRVEFARISGTATVRFMRHCPNRGWITEKISFEEFKPIAQNIINVLQTFTAERKRDQ